ITADFPRLRHVWLDRSYNGKGKGKDWIEQTLGWSAEIVAHRRRPSKVWIFDELPDDQIDWSQYLPPPGFQGLPRRWVVERTFGWQSQQRRLSKGGLWTCRSGRPGRPGRTSRTGRSARQLGTDSSMMLAT